MSDNSCQEFEQRIHELMDRRQSISEDSALASHASQCVVCSALLRDYANLEKLFEKGDHDIGYFDSGNYPAYVDPGPVVREKTPFVLHRLAPWSALVSMIMVAVTAGLFMNHTPAGPTLADGGHVSSTVEDDSDQSALELIAERPESDEFYAAVVSFVGMSPKLETPDRHIRALSELSNEIQSFDAVYRLSGELPGIRPINVTWNLINESLSGSPESDEPASPEPDQTDSDNGTSYLYVQLCSVV
ncbi:MAG: hypothetical protein AAF456_23870 [Planctomycetota bacterium]